MQKKQVRTDRKMNRKTALKKRYKDLRSEDLFAVYYSKERIICYNTKVNHNSNIIAFWD